MHILSCFFRLNNYISYFLYRSSPVFCDATLSITYSFLLRIHMQPSVPMEESPVPSPYAHPQQRGIYQTFPYACVYGKISEKPLLRFP